MAVSLRWLRLRAVWVLVVAFIVFARPFPGALVAGALVALPGALIRGWAAGTIRKDRELATTGPYAYTRNPLYLGSFLMGLGATIAGGRPTFVILFLIFFGLVYGKTMQGEREGLEARFGDAYRRWADRVPLLVPRLTPYRPDHRDGEVREGGGFSLKRYVKNREWEAGLGLVAGFAVLAAKLVWL